MCARFLIAVVLLVTASPAHAGTLTGETRDRDGTTVGTMKYQASAGIANRVAIDTVDGPQGSYIEISDSAEPMSVSGDCTSTGRHSARCPYTESDAPIAVFAGNRDDRVRVDSGCSDRGRCMFALVRGGPGDDVITGGGHFYGDSGNDVMRGIKHQYSWDRFHGGPGRDRMVGGGRHPNGLSDVFFDDERDGWAARDVVIAGRNARARIDYSLRERGMKIDLHRSRMAPEGDIVSDVRSVRSGAGDDVLIGTGGPNELGGGLGEDRLYGRRGDDTLAGGAGDDAMYGEAGDDTLEEPGYFYNPRGGHEEGGRDLFVGGPGADQVRSVRSQPVYTESDRVRCDGRDGPVFSDRRDRLQGCRVVAGWDIGELEIRTRPQLTTEGAVFTLRCAPTEMEPTTNPDGSPGFIMRCRGELTLRSTRREQYGSQTFSFEMENYRTQWVRVTVPLTADGRSAIRGGDVIEVDAVGMSMHGWRFDPAGYRAVLGG